MNKMIIHYCGGCGINISKSVNNKLASLGSGFCEVVTRYVDTSHNNMDGLDINDLWKIDALGYSDKEVMGSGGDRTTNAATIVHDIKKYLDNSKYISEVTSEFHVVVFSAAGGSGSIIGPVIISELRSRGASVIGVVVSDSSNGLSCKNSLNTIATLDHIAKVAIQKPITIVYYNNVNADGVDVGVREAAVNDKIYRTIMIMSLYMSGANRGIDTKDMINFISPDKYNSITVDPGLYCVNIHTNGNVANIKDNINLIGRSLTCPGEDTLLDLTLLQHKYGKVIDKDAVSKVKDITPLHIILAGNCLVNEHTLLTNTVEEYENIMSSITTKTLSGTNKAVEETGLIF